MIPSRTTETPSWLPFPLPVMMSTSPGWCTCCCRNQASARATASLLVGNDSRRFSVRDAPNRTSSNACLSPRSPTLLDRFIAATSPDRLGQHAAVEWLGRRDPDDARQRGGQIDHARELRVLARLDHWPV